MKALTVCQSRADEIVKGPKRVENRTWFTAYTGPLLIHAGKSKLWLEPGDEERYPDMAFGAIVGQCVVEGCRELRDIRPPTICILNRWPWLAEHEHTEGPWCWILGSVRRFQTPIPYRGQQGLFDIPDHVVARAVLLEATP